MEISLFQIEEEKDKADSAEYCAPVLPQLSARSFEEWTEVLSHQHPFPSLTLIDETCQYWREETASNEEEPIHRHISSSFMGEVLVLSEIRSLTAQRSSEVVQIRGVLSGALLGLATLETERTGAKTSELNDFQRPL